MDILGADTEVGKAAVQVLIVTQVENDLPSLVEGRRVSGQLVVLRQGHGAHQPPVQRHFGPVRMKQAIDDHGGLIPVRGIARCLERPEQRGGEHPIHHRS